MTILFSWVIPYIVIIMFLAGMTLRILSWLKVPVPFRLTVFPCPQTRAGATADLVTESVGFKSLWRGDKSLWFMSALFHLSLAFILIGHFFGIAFLGQQFTWLGTSPETSMSLSVMFGTYAGIALSLEIGRAHV